VWVLPTTTVQCGWQYFVAGWIDISIWRLSKKVSSMWKSSSACKRQGSSTLHEWGVWLWRVHKVWEVLPWPSSMSTNSRPSCRQGTCLYWQSCQQEKPAKTQQAVSIVCCLMVNSCRNRAADGLLPRQSPTTQGFSTQHKLGRKCTVVEILTHVIFSACRLDLRCFDSRTIACKDVDCHPLLGQCRNWEHRGGKTVLQ